MPDRLAERLCVSLLGYAFWSRVDLDADGGAPQAALLGHDGPLVVPADVALGGADLLALPFAGQGMGAARAEVVTTLADAQSAFDGTGIHPTPPRASCPTLLWPHKSFISRRVVNQATERLGVPAKWRLIASQFSLSAN